MSDDSPKAWTESVEGRWRKGEFIMEGEEEEKKPGEKKVGGCCYEEPKRTQSDAGGRAVRPLILKPELDPAVRYGKITEKYWNLRIRCQDRYAKSGEEAALSQLQGC